MTPARKTLKSPDAIARFAKDCFPKDPEGWLKREVGRWESEKKEALRKHMAKYQKWTKPPQFNFSIYDKPIRDLEAAMRCL